MIPYSMDYMRRQLRVCIYARVSTEHEAQISALEISWIGISRYWITIRNGHWLSDILMKASPAHPQKSVVNSCG